MNLWQISRRSVDSEFSLIFDPVYWKVKKLMPLIQNYTPSRWDSQTRFYPFFPTVKTAGKTIACPYGTVEE